MLSAFGEATLGAGDAYPKVEAERFGLCGLGGLFGFDVLGETRPVLLLKLGCAGVAH